MTQIAESQKQLRLPFTPQKERRLERIERLLGAVPKLKTAAKLFDEQAYREASAIAPPGGGVSSGKPSSVDRSGYRAHFSAYFEGVPPVKSGESTRLFANHNDAVI